jgi:hypothetical protein
VCDQICNDCQQSPPCIVADTQVPCNDWNRHFRSRKCLENHKQPRGKKEKNLFVRRLDSDTCNELIIRGRSVRKHECFKRFCSNCMCNKETGHLCYITPLSPEMPSSDKVLYVFYDFQTTQNTKVTESATVRVPNLVCVQQFCTLCEAEPDIDRV